MKGDFTRWTFNPAKNYATVLLQQGRVLFDADWNEQGKITQALQRGLARDLIGLAAGPSDALGFGVSAVDADGDGTAEGLSLAPGRYYVAGITCELHTATSMSAQPDLPGFDPLAGAQPGRYAVYLDVWERHVTSIEDAELKEKALGGPDHTTRAQVVAQARLLPLDDLALPECTTLYDPVTLATVIEGTRGRLAASVDPAPASIDPCIVPATAGYRGLENQLYRVEIHRSGNDDSVTFKWSRDNGSVVTTWDDQPDPVGQPQVIIVADLGPDQDRGFQVSDLLVELHDDSHQLAPAPGILARVAQADEASRTLTLKESMDAGGAALPLGSISRGASALHPRVRRWDCAAPRRIDAVDQNDGTHDWVQLEQGVRVRFEHGAGRSYRSGDYWMIPARTVDGSITWEPNDLQLPHGAEHHYACLAIVELDAGGNWSVERNCQTPFPAASNLVQLQYAGGDGQQGVLGAMLPAPLRVQVLNGGEPVAGAGVLFRLVEPLASDGFLTNPLTAATNKVLSVETDPNGIAQVRFTMPTEAAGLADPALIDQRVEAVLLDSCDANTPQVIVFTCHESQAREVRYDNAAPMMAALEAAGLETDNVQRALDVLSNNPHLDYIAGDGQEAPADTELPNDLVVRVGNGAFPMPAIDIIFTMVDMADGSDATDEAWAGSLTPPVGATVEAAWPSTRARAVRATTNAEGLATIRWRLGSPSNRRPGVTARVVLPAPYDTLDAGAAIRFGASIQDLSAGCGEIVIAPGSDLDAVFASIPTRGNARICIHPGEFVRNTPLVVSDKGHLIISGAGAATRLRGNLLDQVIQFVDCDGISLRDLTIDARARGVVGDGLLGAVTFLNCGEVDLERVSVQSDGHGTRRMSGIEARRQSDVRNLTVRIQHCDVAVGHGQTGILILDADAAELRDNQVTCPQNTWSLQAALQDPTVAAWVGRKLMSRIEILPEDAIDFVGSPAVLLSDDSLEDFALTVDPGRPRIALGANGWRVDGIISFTVDPLFADPDIWHDLLTANPLPGTTRRTARQITADLTRFRVRLARAAFGLPTLPPLNVPGNARVGLTPIVQRLLRDNSITAGGQGIVIGGKRTPAVGATVTLEDWNQMFVGAPYAPSARVSGNRVTGFTQGIHIGTSDNTSAQRRRRRMRTYLARVTDNTVTLRVPSLARERHGIFVGNAHQVQVRDNVVERVYPTIERWLDQPPLDGIRLWGSYGPMLHVTGNHCAGTSTGLVIQVVNRDMRTYPSLSWVAEANSYSGYGAADRIVML